MMLFHERSSPSSSPESDTEMEEALTAMLDRKRLPIEQYRARSIPQVENGLRHLLAARNVSHAFPTNIRRLSGGSSKEQFAFEMSLNGDADETFVLRMDPGASIVDTLRERETEILGAMQGRVPAPQVVMADFDGSALGQPGMVMPFVNGVTRPKDGGSGLSGLGTSFPDRLSSRLAPQYIGNLAKIHTTDFGAISLPSFSVPQHPHEPALWQINYWSRVWREDRSQASPLLALTEAWLRDHAPACDRPVLLHGDYRVGNFLFDEDRCEITAILDWELAHIGDPHEDLSYNLQPLFGSTNANGQPMIAAMFTRDAFLSEYEKASGISVDRAKLHFYDVLNTYKLIVLNRATAIKIASARANHQNAYLTYMAIVMHTLEAQLPALLRGERR